MNKELNTQKELLGKKEVQTFEAEEVEDNIIPLGRNIFSPSRICHLDDNRRGPQS